MSDLIDRQEAIRIIKNAKYPKTDIQTSFDLGRNAGLEFASVIVEGLPTAEPKRGRWIKLDMHIGMADHKCTACERECYVPTCMGEPMYAFCPNCGAKMEVTT